MIMDFTFFNCRIYELNLIHLMQGRNVTQFDTTNCAIIIIFIYVAFIYYCTRLPGQLLKPVRVLWIRVKTSDNNQGYFDHAVLTKNKHTFCTEFL